MGKNYLKNYSLVSKSEDTIVLLPVNDMQAVYAAESGYLKKYHSNSLLIEYVSGITVSYTGVYTRLHVGDSVSTGDKIGIITGSMSLKAYYENDSIDLLGLFADYQESVPA